MIDQNEAFANFKRCAEKVSDALSHYSVGQCEALEIVAIAHGYHDFRHASKELTKNGPRTFNLVPSFFRALCSNAESLEGETYCVAGSHFGLHCANMLEPEDDHNIIKVKLKDLALLLNSNRRRDVELIFAWLTAEFPACMALVPSGERHNFVSGILAVHDERDITRL